MTTPREFLESFFKEKLAVYADANLRLAPIYAKCFGAPLLNRAEDFLLLNRIREVVDTVEESSESATIVTRTEHELWPQVRLRYRYHLSSGAGGWKITRMDRECIRCKGTRQVGDSSCPYCGGEGWYDSDKTRPKE